MDITSEDTPDGYQDWWDLKRHKDSKPLWVKGCEHYVDKKKLEPLTLKFDNELLLDMLDDIAKFDPKLKHFPKEHFNT